MEKNENKIVIVSDENGIVAFDDITVKHDTVNRAEVAEVKAEIERLETERTSIDDRIVELKAQVLYAEKIIAIADAQRKSESESVAVESTSEPVPVSEPSILADATDDD